MPIESKIHYNPSLNVAENAKRNGVTVSAIRYYIKTRGIDRRYDAKANIISDIQKYLKKHPEATIREVVKATGHGVNTVKRYWDIAHGKVDAENLRNGNKAVKKKIRELNNFYATHPSCTADLLREEEFYHYILEPFCGVGTMSEVLKEHGHEVLSYDIVDRGYGEVGDFFAVDFEKRKYDIVSNPPYDEYLADIVARCVELCHKKVALLMPLRYLSGQDRYKEIYRKYPPVRVYVYLERINIAQGADFERYNDAGANREIYAWFVWERGYKGDTVLKWMHNDRKRCGLPTVKTAAQKLKEEIDNMVATERKNFSLLQEHPAYLPEVVKKDIAEPQKTVYDTTRYCCVAFRSKNDLWKEHKVPFGNMNGGYQYQINGVYVPTSEHAYILGLFSDNTEEHKAIQEELLREPSGYNAKRGIRNGHRNLWRADWHDYNREWMLYVVWEKVRQCEDFRQLLMSLPEGTAIIEDVSFKPKDEKGADFWGARNPDKKVFGGLVRKYVKSMRLSTKRAMEDAENSLLWDFCCYGQYEGYNVMGKILTYIKQCLHDGTKPDIDYELLKSKNIHFLGNLIDFDSSDAKYQPSQCDRALVLDFDMTLFNTATDREARLNKDWKAVYNEIPNYTLYDGWREVFKYAQENGVKIIVISRAKGEIIKRALKHYDLHCDVVIGGGVWGHPKKTSKNSGKLIDIALQEIGCQDMPKSQIISIGDSVTDKNMSDNAGVKFYGAIWDCEKEESYAELSKGDTIQSPLDVIKILNELITT